MYCWLEKRGLRRGKDRKTYEQTGGASWLGPENNGRTDAPNPP